MSDAVRELDQTVRRADPDRWLASRFIDDPQARADVVALYAFNNELARAPEAASDPLIAEIRLTWWAEALDEMFEGRSVRGHPAAQALAGAVGRRGLDRAVLDSMIEARMSDAHRAPFRDEGELFAYLDATAGSVMRLAALILDADPGIQVVRAAGRVWGLAGLARWRALGVASRLPEALTPVRAMALTSRLARTAREATKAVPVKAFPAVAYACLARAYARGRNPTLLEKQARLMCATATGRV